MTRTIALVLVFMFVVGCAGAETRAARNAYTAQMAEQPVSTIGMPVSTPIQRPLVLVVSEERVVLSVDVANTPHSIAGFNAFVGLSLQQALAPYFTDVLVVGSADEVPAEPHFLADVTVGSVAGNPLTIGHLVYTMIVMEWSIGLRASESQDYVFSAIGEATSEQQYATLDEGAKQMMKSAIRGLQKAWTEEEMMQTLRAIDGAQPVSTEQPLEARLF